MATNQQPKDQGAKDEAAAALQAQAQQQDEPRGAQAHGHAPDDDFDGLEGKKPSELTPEELRLMADTMPGEGPGD